MNIKKTALAAALTLGIGGLCGCQNDTPLPSPTVYPPRETVAPLAFQRVKAEPEIKVRPEVETEVEPEIEVTAETEPEPEPEPVLTYLGTYQIYGYDACYQCCGKTDGITYSGTKAEAGRTVAAPFDIPIGTVLYIEGIGERVVEDRGGLAGNTLDVFCSNHPECYAITGRYDVYIVE